MEFRDWLEQQETVENVLRVFNENVPVPHYQNQKPWSAKKDEIIGLWKNLSPDLPITIQPMAGGEGEDHRSYGEDGIRITGSWQFILSTISHLKQILGYENETGRLQLVFRAITPEKNSRKDRQSFAFYINLKPRSKGSPGRKKL